ncbi:hypothetical protein BaRGS_00015770 [Batillaria attramentaria]|uniref:Secreted protein n=1 Tax=Batillaria attramentaria TaxID=370345 RepID=A0ABD0L0R7_9CAEN
MGIPSSLRASFITLTLGLPRLDDHCPLATALSHEAPTPSVKDWPLRSVRNVVLMCPRDERWSSLPRETSHT